MICWKCHRHVSDSSLTCPFCGANLVIIPLLFVIGIGLLSSGSGSDEPLYRVTKTVNCRTAPVTGKVIGSRSAGLKIHCDKVENGWCKTEYNGETCYISAKYLSKK